MTDVLRDRVVARHEEIHDPNAEGDIILVCEQEWNTACDDVAKELDEEQLATSATFVRNLKVTREPKTFKEK